MGDKLEAPKHQYACEAGRNGVSDFLIIEREERFNTAPILDQLHNKHGVTVGVRIPIDSPCNSLLKLRLFACLHNRKCTRNDPDKVGLVVLKSRVYREWLAAGKRLVW